jgi:hypothetical protein
MSNAQNIIECATPPARTRQTEEAIYLALRIGIALVGLLVIVLWILSEFIAPKFFYMDTPGGVPPLRDRLPGIIVGLGIGVLLCLPHRWTRQNWLFWPRLGIYCILAVYLLWLGVDGIVAGLAGGKSWHIFPVSVIAGCIGVSLPLCLLWARRIRRAT